MAKKKNQKKGGQKAAIAAAAAAAAASTPARVVQTEKSAPASAPTVVEAIDAPAEIEEKERGKYIVQGAPKAVDKEQVSSTTSISPKDPLPNTDSTPAPAIPATVSPEDGLPEGHMAEIHRPSDDPSSLAIPVPAEIHEASPFSSTTGNSNTTSLDYYPLESTPTSTMPLQSLGKTVPEPVVELKAAAVESLFTDSTDSSDAFAGIDTSIEPRPELVSAAPELIENHPEPEPEETKRAPSPTPEPIPVAVPGAAPEPPALNDLFGTSTGSDDVFAQIGGSIQEDNVPRAAEEPVNHVASVEPALVPQTLGDLFGSNAGDDDAFTQLGSSHPEPVVVSQPVPPSPSKRAPTVDDLFGGDHDDNTAQIQPSSKKPASPLVQSNTEPSKTATIDDLFAGQDDAADPFGQIAGQDDHTTRSTASFAAAEPSTLKGTEAEKYSDLLAEFEDEFVPLSAEQIPEQQQPVVDTKPVPQKQAHDAFDDLVAEFEEQGSLDKGAAAPLETPALNGAQSFGGAGDWFVDTGHDDVSDVLEQEEKKRQVRRIPDSPIIHAVTEQKVEDHVRFEVPQGWYDELGNWHWYTEEEKVQVREAMLSQETAWGAPAPGEPELAAPVSENAARRTPQPAPTSQLVSQSYDLYTPSTQPSTASTYDSSAYTPSSYAPSPAIVSQAAPYAPSAPTFTPAAPALSAKSYDPYAPTSSTTLPAANPYAPVANPYAPSASAPLPKPSATPKEDTPRPDPPKRVASNAYDPPFLRPSKSFVRPPSAVPIASVFTSTPEKVASPPPPAAPSAPPMGPPRRSKTPSAPAFSAPPPRKEIITPVLSMPTNEDTNVSRAPSVGPAHVSPMQQYTPGPQSVQVEEAPAPHSAIPVAAAAAAAAPSPYDPYAPAPKHPRQPIAPRIPPIAAAAPAPPATTAPPFRPPPSRTKTYDAFDPPLRSPTHTHGHGHNHPRARPATVAPVAPVVPGPTSTLPVPPLPTLPQIAPSAPPAGPPRGPSRGSMRKPTFETKPAFEPPPRSSTAGPPSNTHLPPPDQFLSRPPSRTQQEFERIQTPPPPSPAFPTRSPVKHVHLVEPPAPEPEEEHPPWKQPEPVAEVADEGYDPEGGVEGGSWEEEEEEEVSVAIDAPDKDHYDPEGAGHDEERWWSTEKEEASHEEPRADSYAPSSYAPSSYAPATHVPPPPEKHSEPSEDLEEAPSTQPHAPSSYTPVAPPKKIESDPYAPSSYAPSAYQPSAPQPSEPKRAESSVYDPYAPPSTQPEVTSKVSIGSPKGQSRSNDLYAPPSHAPSAYAPSPYQPSHQSHQPQTPVKPPDGRTDANGLGFQPIGSPPHSDPRNIYDPHAPSPWASQDAYNPYAPPDGKPGHKTSNSGSYGGYVPAQPNLLNPTDAYSRASLGSSYGSDRTISPQPGYFQHMTATTDYVPQQVLEQRPVSEDPLGRCTLAARNAPLAVFGFGGVLITAFPALADEANSHIGHNRTPSYGYASGRGELWIRSVSELVSTSALMTNDTEFPGPLVLDPKTPKGATGEKKKREAVLGYLDTRAEEIEKGLPYLKSSANQARREEEGKLVLVRLLKAMVIGDGKLSGSQQVEDALRAALANDGGSSGPANFVSAASLSNSVYPSSTPATTVKASSSQLTKLSNLLSAGDKRDAVRYAADAGLWAHALVISSSVDPELWSETVMRFSEAELSKASGVAALQASYSVFAGRLASSMDDLLAATNLTGGDLANAQDSWREVVGAVIFNGKPADLAHLDEIGARFRKAGLNYPAHVCNVLAPTSPFADITPGAYERVITLTQNPHDPDAIIFAEIAEYARSLVAVPKGLEPPFIGLPQLLPYKLQRAWLSAELGDAELAKRYLTAVESASKPGKNGASVLPPALLASLEDLTERLTGTPSVNPARGIGGRKSKAGVGSWLESRLSKFIAGDEDTLEPVKEVAPAKGGGTDANSTPVGPFSHFSTISPSASGPITRNSSTADFGNISMTSITESRRASSVQEAKQASPLKPATSQRGGLSDDTSNGGGGGWQTWTGVGAQITEEPSANGENGDAGDEGEYINPMGGLSFGSLSATPVPPTDYTPKAVDLGDEEDEDLGFGNSSLSRSRTPKHPTDGAAAETKGDTKAKAAASPAKAAPPPEETKEEGKPAHKSSWFGKLWGKSEGGPIRAKLGEESSMVFDPELKRWVVKGQKPEAAPAPPPPPPRASTASPASAPRGSGDALRPTSAAPPPGPPRAFTEMPDGGIRRQKPLLSTPPSTSAPSPAGTPSSGGPPGPPGPTGGGPPKSAPPTRPTSASIDDLLSRPPSAKRTGAASKKPRNKYVDVFQGQA